MCTFTTEAEIDAKRKASAQARFWKTLGICHLIAVFLAAAVVGVAYLTMGSPAGVEKPLSIVAVVYLAASVLGTLLGAVLYLDSMGGFKSLKTRLQPTPKPPPESADQRLKRIEASVEKRFNEAVASGDRYVYLEFKWTEGEKSNEFADKVISLANACETLESLHFVHFSGYWSGNDNDEADFALLTFKRPK